MADQQSIVLNKWYGGMGNDEYTGSFFYGENVDIRTNSKGFRLSDRVVQNIMNYRSSGYYNKILSDYQGTQVLGLSQDGYVEGYSTNYEGASSGANSGAYLYKRASGGYRNGILAGNYLACVTNNDKLDVLNIGTTYSYGYGLWGSQLVTTPDLTSDTGWTVGAGWTTGSGGAVHTAGNTGTLSQTVTPDTGTGIISVYIGSWTAGTLAVSYGGTSLGTLSITSGVNQNKRYTFNIITTASDAIVLTPSSDFDGTVKFVNVRKYDSTKIKSDLSLSVHGSFGDFDNRAMLYDGGILYIASGNKIETIDTTLTLSSWSVSTGLTLQTGDKIIGITKIGDVFNIYANNGISGIKYIWNGVDELPSEKIEWKNKPFKSVDGDGNQDYAICGNDYDIRLYATVGYEKQLLYRSGFMTNADSNYECYRLGNRFDYKKVIGFSNDTLWLGGYYGVYTYGTENPELTNSMVKEHARNYHLGGPFDGYGIRSMTFINTPYISYRTLGQSYNYNCIGELRQYQFSKLGHIVSNPLIFDSLSTEKILNKLRIGYLLPSDTCSIKIYAKVNDRYFTRFYVNSVSTVPSVGDTYTNYNDNVFTVIGTDLSDIVIGDEETITMFPSSSKITQQGASRGGIMFTALENCNITEVTGEINGTLTLKLESTGAVLATGGNVYTYDLVQGTNYILYGDGLARRLNSAPSFPYVGTNINIYAGYYNGSQDNTYAYDIFSITTQAIPVLGAGYITCTSEYPSDVDGFSYGGTLTKLAGDGQASITYTDRDNFCLIKTITTDKYKYGNEYILGQAFIDAYLPIIHKLQLKIELISTSASYTPEVFDIPVLADVVQNEF